MCVCEYVLVGMAKDMLAFGSLTQYSSRSREP